MELRGESWSAEDEEAFKAPIREKYEAEGSPYYSTARLWDDGVIAAPPRPAMWWRSLSPPASTPRSRRPGFGVFRM